MYSIKINHNPTSHLTSSYLNKQVVDRVGGPGVRCTLTLLHPADGPKLFFCNSLNWGHKISAPEGEFDGWWIWEAKNTLPESTPQLVSWPDAETCLVSRSKWLHPQVELDGLGFWSIPDRGSEVSPVICAGKARDQLNHDAHDRTNR